MEQEQKEGEDKTYTEDDYGFVSSNEPLYEDIFEQFCIARTLETKEEPANGIKEYLDCCSKLGSWPLKEVSSGLSSKEMDLSNLDLTVEELSAINVGLRENESVETLRLTQNRLGDSGVSKVCAAIAGGRISKVRSLYAQGVGMSDESAGSIVDAIRARTESDSSAVGK